MAAFLGTLGALFPVECDVAPVQRGSRYTFESSAERKRSAQVRPYAPRAWDVSLDVGSSAEMGNLFALDAGEFGNGPFLWVTDEAQAANLLTPEVSTCGPAADVGSTVAVAGPMNLPGGGRAGRSLTNSDTTQNLNFGPVGTPVIPGVPVTASAYLLGDGAQIGLNFHDAAGTFISAVLSSAVTTAGQVARLSVSVAGTAVPSTAASVQVFGKKTSQGARPAVTWTSGPAAWFIGGGCRESVLSAIKHDPVVLGAQESYRNVSFTVMEVGG